MLGSLLIWFQTNGQFHKKLLCAYRMRDHFILFVVIESVIEDGSLQLLIFRISCKTSDRAYVRTAMPVLVKQEPDFRWKVLLAFLLRIHTVRTTWTSSQKQIARCMYSRQVAHLQYQENAPLTSLNPNRPSNETAALENQVHGSFPTINKLYSRMSFFYEKVNFSQPVHHDKISLINKPLVFLVSSLWTQIIINDESYQHIF